jgi:hypothetical protein
MLTSFRRRSRHIDNLRPTLVLLSAASTVLHRCDNSTNNNNNVDYPYLYVHVHAHTHTQFDFPIQLLDWLFLLCSQPWRRMLSKRTNMRYRCILPWRASHQHTSTRRARTAYKRLSHTICIANGRCMSNRLLRLQRLLPNRVL